jgi:DNA-binding NarL/FixJ family response regulator
MMTIYIQEDDNRREATADEVKAIEADRLRLGKLESQELADEAAKKAARESALAKLAALGLTEAEIAAL